LPEGVKRFFKLFQESTLEGSQAAALEMKNIVERQTKQIQRSLLFHSLHYLIRFDSKMLSWPNSPLLVLLHFVDPNVLSGDEQMSDTLLHQLGDLAAPSDYSTYENQLILAKQLIEHGANANAVSSPHGLTPLHRACYAGNLTNLDFVELLLEAGADPNSQTGDNTNSQDHSGATPLMVTIKSAPGAAKFLLNWPSTDTNITTQSGASFLTWVRSTITSFAVEVVRPNNPRQVQHQLLLRQWREIEKVLLEREAAAWC
jgi:ankyrin repeat protein